MTMQKPPLPLDKFGLATEGASVQHHRRRTSHHWVPIRDLHAHHRRRIVDHLLALDARDRYLRFGHSASAEEVSKYVASIDFRRDEVFGIFGRHLQLMAVAHLAAMPGGDPKTAANGQAMEFGVSVLAEGRGQGLGLRLFQHAITHARNRGASHLMIYALSENAPMLRIAAKAGATVEHHGSDAEGWLKLPPHTVATRLDSSLQSLAAEAIYRIKYRIAHINDWVRMMMFPAQ
ncbi:MAG: N-acetyltransferase [Burkholderiales bacterium]|nr:N-acetyltransferase [Burkholderiales bacterium]